MKSLRKAFVPALALGLASVVWSESASAAEEAQPEWFTKPNERRAGFVLGLVGGVGIGGATGYPNKASQIGDPAYFAGSGLGAGGAGSVVVLGALTDTLNFGIWFGGGSTQNSSWKSSTGGAGFRIEAFPLYGLSPHLRDLGVVAQVGFGATKIEPRYGTHTTSEGVQSYLGLGAFYEWRITRVFSGHLAGGPSIDYSAALSRSVDRHDLSFGGRIVLYTAL